MEEYSLDQIDKRIDEDPEMQHLAQHDETAFLTKHAEIYKSFGYNPDGSPLRRAKKIIGKVAEHTGIPEDVVQFGASSIRPAIGTAAGMAAGAAGGPVGMAIGGAGGSVLGEAGNSLLGINPPMDKADFAMAAGAPLVGPGIAKAAPATISTLKRVISLQSVDTPRDRYSARFRPSVRV